MVLMSWAAMFETDAISLGDFAGAVKHCQTTGANSRNTPDIPNRDLASPPRDMRYNKLSGLTEGIAAGPDLVEESPHSAGQRCRLTAGQGNLTASATESRLHSVGCEGERVR